MTDPLIMPASVLAEVPDDVLTALRALDGDVHYLLQVQGIRVLPYWVSNSIGDVFGVTPESCLHEPLWWSHGLHPDDKDQAQTGVMSLFETGELTHRYRFRHGDGTYIAVRDHLKVFRHDHRLSYVIGSWTVEGPA